MMYGNRNARRKLTEDDVRLIRELHEYKMREVRKLNDTLSTKALAEKFDCSTRCIEAVLSRRNWGI